MDIVMIGISVENADLALLGSVSFTDTAKLEMLNLLGGLDIAAGVILSTCNRSESPAMHTGRRKRLICIGRFFILARRTRSAC